MGWFRELLCKASKRSELAEDHTIFTGERIAIVVRALLMSCLMCTLAILPPGKHRGYAFIEFEHKKDMKEAYKQADGKKIEGRRVVVDVERGRTVEAWCVCRGCGHIL